MPRLYEAVLASWRPPRVTSKPPLPVTLLTFCGSRQLPLLRECLISLLRSWPELPKVRVVSDGTLSPGELDVVLDWWPGELALEPWQRSVEALEQDTRSIRRFAERQVTGRKLAAILASARREATLFVDTDVLWFRFPDHLTHLLDRHAPGTEPATLCLSEDLIPSYDPGLVGARLPHLETPPFYCCGFGFAAGDLLAACDLGEALAWAAERGVWFTEQTIFAEAARQIAPEPWPASEVACPTADWDSLRPTFRGQPWAARHYVTPVRHLFWLDALALRLGAGES